MYKATAKQWMPFVFITIKIYVDNHNENMAFGKLCSIRNMQFGDKLLDSESLHCLRMRKVVRRGRPLPIAMAPYFPIRLCSKSLYNLHMFKFLRYLRPLAIATAPYRPI
jgi:hypothetical protein